MDVDQLSIEEAGVIASETVGFALEEGLVDSSEAAIIKRDVENYFKTELVQVRTLDNSLNEESQTVIFSLHSFICSLLANCLMHVSIRRR